MALLKSALASFLFLSLPNVSASQADFDVLLEDKLHLSGFISNVSGGGLFSLVGDEGPFNLDGSKEILLPDQNSNYRYRLSDIKIIDEGSTEILENLYVNCFSSRPAEEIILDLDSLSPIDLDCIADNTIFRGNVALALVRLGVAKRICDRFGINTPPNCIIEHSDL